MPSMTRKKYDAMLKLELPPSGWEALLGVTIMDPDGWRSRTQSYAPRPFDAALPLPEFVGRALVSTIRVDDGDEDFHAAINYRTEDELGWKGGISACQIPGA